MPRRKATDDGLPEGMRRLASGRIQYRYHDAEGNRRSKTFANVKEARNAAARTSADLQRGEYIDPRDAARTFDQLADEWLDTLALQRPKTLAGYRGILDKHLRPYFGSRAVGSIRPTDVRKWLASMTRSGSAPGTIRNAYRVLTPILNQAVEDGCIKASPCAPLRRKDLPQSKASEMLFLTAGQVTKLADAMPDHWGVVIHFAARTGMRAGEINALRMANVDLLRNRVHVRESISEVEGVQHFVPPKTGEERTVTIPPSLSRMLREYLATQPQKGPRDFLCTDPADASKPVAYTRWFYLKVFKPAVVRAGLDPALRFHDLRHTAASLLIAANVGPKVVQKHLGHSSFAITYDRYGHLYPDEAEQQVSDALEAAFAVGN
jgi:integrase